MVYEVLECSFVTSRAWIFFFNCCKTITLCMLCVKSVHLFPAFCMKCIPLRNQFKKFCFSICMRPGMFFWKYYVWYFSK